MKRIITVFLIIILVSGCSFSKVYTDAIEQTENHLVNEEFDQAYDSIQVALNEKPEDNVALNIETGLLKYQELEKFKEKREWDKVSDVIDSFGTLDSVHPKLKKEIDETKKIMIEQVNLEKQVINKLSEIQANIDDDLYDEANILLKELEENKEIEFAKTEVVSMREIYTKSYKKYEEEEKLAKKKKKLDNLLLEYESDLTKAEKSKNKLNDIKKENQYDSTLQASNETEKAYDEVLNKVYQSIIKEFPKEEDNLREVQREWLANYEAEIQNTRYQFNELEALEKSIKLKEARTKELLTEYFS